MTQANKTLRAQALDEPGHAAPAREAVAAAEDSSARSDITRFHAATTDATTATQVDPTSERTQASGELAAGTSLAPGDVVDTYRVVEEVGRGAMGVVFLAVDLTLERKVALKVIHEKLSSSFLRERFTQEARAMARVNDPHVLAIHAFGEHASAPYFVMEFVDGQTLEEYMASLEAPPDLDVALGILSDICKGVSAIHAAGAVHRDLKPSNLLLDTLLRARVADFGLAIPHDENTPGEIAGTPAYMAPEIAFSGSEPGSATPQSDVYALGCIAYELLTGKPVFTSNTDVGVLVQHATVPVTPPSSLRPDLPRAFDQVLLQALEKKPAARTATAELFRRCLLEARNESLEPVRILIAEDDPDFLAILQIGLERAFPDAEIEGVGDGSSLLAAFDRKKPSAVIIDLQMPALDGFAVTALLRSRGSATNVPIVVLTAAGGPQEWKRLSALGADRFLVKPVHLDDLVGMVRRAVRERSSSLPPPMS